MGRSAGKKKSPSPFFVLSSAIVLAAALAGAFLFWLGSAPWSGRGLPDFSVEKGESASSVGRRLEAEGIIRSALLFKALARLEGRADDLKSGTYRFEAGADTGAVLRTLVEGRILLVKLTLAEGLTLGETARAVAAAGVATEAEFLAAAHDRSLLDALGIPAADAEGYLFPETYLMPKGLGGRAAVETMVATLRERLATVPGSSGLTAERLRQGIILASIVEREYRLPEEAPLIASVFANRLRIGMGLQSCATVVYVITERLGKPHPEVVYDRDLRLPDPYNTYTHRGLPPGPIANPGLVALRAAFEPPKTPWLYFRLVDPERGSHHFSTSFEEHLGAAGLSVKRAPGP